jgi:hypothetical protein
MTEVAPASTRGVEAASLPNTRWSTPILKPEAEGNPNCEARISRNGYEARDSSSAAKRAVFYFIS